MGNFNRGFGRLCPDFKLKRLLRKEYWHFLLWEELSTGTCSHYLQPLFVRHNMLPFKGQGQHPFFSLSASMLMYLCPAGAQEEKDVSVVISLLWKLCWQDPHPPPPPLLRNWLLWTGPSESTFPAALKCPVHLHPCELGRLSLKLQALATHVLLL